MTRTILVAGATGWIGQKVAGHLIARGARPRLMARGGIDHPKVAALGSLVQQGAEIVDADIGSPHSLHQALEGIDIVISTLQGGPDVIIDGQVRLAEIALKQGVQRIFLSDYAVDFRDMDETEHLFLGWRNTADRRIAETGLAQTNIFNGAFSEMLLQPFFGLIDRDSNAVTYWGDPDQPYYFTTTDDAAAYVAAAALSDTPPEGAFGVIGQSVSPRQLAQILGTVTGRQAGLTCLGSLDELDSEIARRQASSPQDPMAWAGLQYHRAMASGRGKITDPQNSTYADIVPETVESTLKKALT